MEEDSTLLRVLLRERHWQTYSTFCAEYDKAAKQVDPSLTGRWPSRAQFHRWLSGATKGLPYPYQCRVLEAMLPGHKAAQLFERYDQPGVVAAKSSDSPPATVDRPEWLGSSGELDGILGAYATRSEFVEAVPLQALFEDARLIRAMGLSLNMICQQYSDRRLYDLVNAGTQIRCAFLDPLGRGTKAREEEEGYANGHLTTLTQLNIRTLNLVRERLPEADRDRVAMVTYDGTIRFNITVIDERLSVVQPYSVSSRGVDSPTFIFRKSSDAWGMFESFLHIFETTWEQGTTI